MRYVFIWVFPDFLDTLYVLLHLFKKNNDFNLYLSNISCTKKMLYSGHGSKVKFAVSGTVFVIRLVQFSSWNDILQKI
jgi:hypothetical protein